MRIAYITAGAAGMFCGSCLHDNTLVTALVAQGHDALLIPTYTPIRTDEPDVSQHRIFLGGINVYLQQKLALFRHTPRLFDWLLDFPRLLLEGHAGPRPEYRAGVQRRWLAGDVKRLFASMAGKPEGYPGKFPSVAEAIGDILLRGAPDFVFRWSDPGPFLGEVLGVFA